MISIKEISNQSSETDSFGFITQRSEPALTAHLSAPDPPTCSFYLNQLVQKIDSPELKGLIGTSISGSPSTAGMRRVG